MRKFIYIGKITGYRSPVHTEEQLLYHFREYDAAKYDIYELTPRTIKTVTKREIV